MHVSKPCQESRLYFEATFRRIKIDVYSICQYIIDVLFIIFFILKKFEEKYDKIYVDLV